MTNRTFKVKKPISEKKKIYNRYNSLGITIFWVPTASSRSQIKMASLTKKAKSRKKPKR